MKHSSTRIVAASGYPVLRMPRLPRRIRRQASASHTMKVREDDLQILQDRELPLHGYRIERLRRRGWGRKHIVDFVPGGPAMEHSSGDQLWNGAGQYPTRCR